MAPDPSGASITSSAGSAVIDEESRTAEPTSSVPCFSSRVRAFVCPPSEMIGGDAWFSATQAVSRAKDEIVIRATHFMSLTP